MRRFVAIGLLAAAGVAEAADLPVELWVGRSFDEKQTDVVRGTYRHRLDGEAWWKPQIMQFGAGVWSVPDPEIRTSRYEFSITPIWRRQRGIGYVEGGIGAYLLSHTVNNEWNRLPTAFQFGSHIGAAMVVNKATLGIAVQHLSNARIKQPNGGINFLLLNASVPF
jgi:hypothetical protein